MKKQQLVGSKQVSVILAQLFTIYQLLITVYQFRAGSGNRTHVTCLEGRSNDHYTIPAVTFFLLCERHNRKKNGRLVGERGFEPPTFWSQTKRATKLRYSPLDAIVNQRGANGQD